MGAKTTRTMAQILADMAEVGAFLPGTVRKDFRKKRMADGSVATYEVQPRLNCAVGGRRKDFRIPKARYGEVLVLTRNYARMKALVRELEEAALRENLPSGAKKNS